MKDREIKFRALLKKEAQTQGEKEYEKTHRYFTLEDLMRGKILFSFPQHWNFSQFTGLKDKNGKEIYEGDILEKIIVNRYGTFKERTVAEWEENTSGSGEYDDDYTCGFCFRKASDIDKFEIIGNIYENPELLK